MASKTIEKDKLFSDAEGKLYSYNKTKVEIRSLQLDIKRIKNDYIATEAIDYSSEKTGATNSINCSVENFVIAKERKIDKIRREIRGKQITIDKVDNALRLLNQEELELVKYRYLSKRPMSWQKVGIMLGFTEARCQQLRTEIINNIKHLL